MLALIGILFLSFAFIRGWKKTASLSAFEAEVTEEKKQACAYRACDDDEPGGGNPESEGQDEKKAIIIPEFKKDI